MTTIAHKGLCLGGPKQDIFSGDQAMNRSWYDPKECWMELVQTKHLVDLK